MAVNCAKKEPDCNSSANASLITVISSADSDTQLKWFLIHLNISLAVFGVLSNIFVFIGLKEKSKKMRAPDTLLLHLTLWDSVFLCSRACQHIVNALFALCADMSTCKALNLTYLLFNYVARTSFITSMLSTIPIAVERCLYSVMPIKVTSYSNKRRTWIIMFVVTGLSLFVSIPEMMTVVCVHHFYPEYNFTTHTDSRWSVCSPNSFETIVESSMFLRLAFKILAWIILLVLDSILIHRLILGARNARRMHIEDCGQFNHPRSYNEKSLTLATVALVLMALVAYPVTGLMWALTYKNPDGHILLDPMMTPLIQEAGRTVQLVYASSNLFFLLTFGTRFRRNLFSRLHPCIPRCQLQKEFQR